MGSLPALTLTATSIGVPGSTWASAASIILEDGCCCLDSIHMEYGLNDRFGAGDGGKTVADEISSEPISFTAAPILLKNKTGV